VGGVTLSLLGSSTTPAFDQFFRDPEIALLQPFSTVAWNGSAKSIIALTVRWTWRESSGEVRVWDLRTDSLFPPHAALAAPGERILILPGTFLRESPAGRGFITVGKSTLLSHLRQFERASDVVVSLDAIVFETGQIVGADESRTAEYLNARKAAADSLSKLVLTALQAGRDPSDALSEIAGRPRTAEDYLGLWTSRLARTLLRATNKKAVAEQLAALPALTLHRSQ